MTTEITTPETLWRAASLMRRLAQAVERDGGGWFAAENLRGFHEPVNADHIAVWSPAVALDVANLLEVVSHDVRASTPTFHAAQVLARTYLGDE